MGKKNAKIAYKIMDMVGVAIENIKVETWTDVKEISLYTEIPLTTMGEGYVAYAVTRFSAVCTNGKSVKFLALDEDDLLNIRNIIHKEYDIDY